MKISDERYAELKALVDKAMEEYFTEISRRMFEDFAKIPWEDTVFPPPIIIPKIISDDIC